MAVGCPPAHIDSAGADIKAFANMDEVAGERLIDWAETGQRKVALSGAGVRA